MSKPVIGLTGPTGSGKSTAAAVFRRMGCAVIDADQLARLAAENRECLERLVREFGSGILHPDGTLDRNALAGRAFSDPARTQALNRITHPFILEETVRLIRELQKTPDRAVVLDAALLLESGADSLCDVTVVVTAPPEIRLRRIMERDGITERQAKERMDAQNGNEYYTARADYMLDGNSGLSRLNETVSDIMRKIMKGRDGGQG